MSAAVPTSTGAGAAASGGGTVAGRFHAWVATGQNWVVVASMAVMAVLPVVEIVLRKFFKEGLSGSAAIVQHLTLAVGMLGGVLAARDGRLLSMSAVNAFLTGRALDWARLVSSVIAVVATIFLAVGGVQLVIAERSSDSVIAYGVPAWVGELLVPVGFVLIAGYLLWLAGKTWKPRVGAVLVTGLVVWLLLHPPVDPEKLVVPALCVLLVATVLGAPVFVTLGGASVILFWGAGQPISAITISHYKLVTNPSLPAIPLFTLTGYLLAESGASQRFVRVFQSLFAGIRGGPAIVTCLVCAFFTTFTGASGVTILALGGPLIPVLLAAKYSERHALGFLTSAGALGLLFPPCLPLILYAIIAKDVSLNNMFLGGLLPGLLLVALTAALGIALAPRQAAARPRFDRAAAWSAIWAAKWELLIPVVALAGLLGGFATPVESAALTALYTFAIEVFIYRDLNVRKDFGRVFTEAGLVVGGVLLILGVAQGFTNYLVDEQLAAKAVEWVTANIHSKAVFLLVLTLFLFVVGSLMDVFSAIIVVVPLMVPMAKVYGIDPVHLGILFLANLELGYLMPPMGMNLFLASYRFNKPLAEVYRFIVPMLLVQMVGVFIITYLPILSTLLPKWFGK